MPPNDSQKGNHYIVFKIDVPKTLTAEQRALYEELAKIESPIDPKTVKFADDEQPGSGKGSGGQESGGKKEEWEEDTDRLFDLFKKMFRNRFIHCLLQLIIL